MSETRKNEGEHKLATDTLCCRCWKRFLPSSTYQVEQRGLSFFYSHPECEAKFTPPNEEIERLRTEVMAADNIWTAIEQTCNDCGYHLDDCTCLVGDLGCGCQGDGDDVDPDYYCKNGVPWNRHAEV